jgi:FkbM family methyltransferase
MRIDAPPHVLAEELNLALDRLHYAFDWTPDYSWLRVGMAPTIRFPHDLEGTAAEACTRWVRRKHADGAIHEPATVAALVWLARRFSDEPVTFFDVGALYGYFSLIAKALFPAATVRAFDMNPDSCQAMEQVFRANHHLGDPQPSVINVGLSDHTEPAHRSTIKNFVLDEEPSGRTGVPVDLVRLDDFCAQTGLRPDLMKIDVEGYQAKIMPGAMATIAAHQPAVMIEFDLPVTLARFAARNLDVVQPLLDLGYQFFWCENHRDRDGRFTHVPAGEFSAEHETNSLGVFVMP